MPWDNRYETGHPEIDRQHRLLFGLIEQVGKVEGGSCASGRNAALDLMDAILQHAAYEERLMATYAYPMEAAHREGHRAFTHQVIKFREDIISGQLDQTEYQSFLDAWWHEHVRGGDRDLAAFLDGRL